MFSDLTADDLVELDAKRAVIAKALRARAGGVLTRSTSDLRLLQSLINGGAFARDARYELQSLGICFGDVLARESPLRWVIIEDACGRDPTLRWAESSLAIHAMTMISKRIESGEHVDIARLAAGTLKMARERAALEA